LNIFDHPEFDQHESVSFFSDAETGLQMIIAVHSTALGPAGGGVRRWVYASEADAVTDVLRLSRGMSYKCAVAGLEFGGGKAVILAGDAAPKTPGLLAALGRAVNSLGGQYVAAGDVGMSDDDMRVVRSVTPYVSGLPQEGSKAGGNPGPWTALGIYLGLKTTAQYRLGTDSLEGVRVAVQGVGSVGGNLCQHLAKEGAEIFVADVNPQHLQHITGALDVTVLPPEEIIAANVDVLAPCALGKILNVNSIPTIKAKVIAGSANNQLEVAADGQALAGRGILYAPDYVINAGGIASCCFEYFGAATDAETRANIEQIPARLLAIYQEAAETGLSTNRVADALASRLVAAAAKSRGQKIKGVRLK
jgi:leucine dehydrogenase